MWHIRRVRLESVGHPEARFDPLLLDFTDADGAPADSVVWLDNMGGKTSLLSLIMATLRPARRDFLGGLQDGKRIEEYVLADDTAHVVIEWQRLGAPSLFGGAGAPRLVTGQVLQWRDNRVDLDNPRNLLRRFYGFVATSRVGFDTVPIRSADHRRLRFASFFTALTELLQGTERIVTDHHDQWHEWLAGHGLDPEVFRYQLRMNADEGAVAAQFQWPDGNAFVRWALSVMINPELLNMIAGTVDKVRDRLAQRERLQLERDFCTQVGAQLDTVAAEHARFEAATKELAAAWDDSARLASAMQAAAEIAHQRAELATAQAEQAEEAARAARARADHLARQRNEALIRAAELWLAEVKRQLAEAEGTARHAGVAVRAWEAGDLLIQARKLEGELELLDDQLRAHEAETQPLRDAADRAATALARKLTAQRDGAEQDARAAEEALEAARHRLAKVEGQLAQVASEIADAKAEAARLEERLRALDQEVHAARTRGLLAEGELPPAAHQRHLDRKQHALEDRARAAAADDEAAARLTAAQEALEAARTRNANARAALQGAQQAVAALEEARERLAHDPQLVAAAQAEPVPLWEEPPLLLDRLASLAEAAAGARLTVELRVAADRRALQHLERERLLPPAADVERVLSLLERAGVRSAYSGWQVLRDTRAAAERPALIAAHPELAGGVLLTNPEELPRARAVLADAEVSLPVVVAPAAALTAEAQEHERIVLPGPEALHDETAAGAERRRRQEDLAAAGEEIARCRHAEREAQEAAARYRSFLAQWPRHRRDQLLEEARHAQEEAEAAAAVLAAAQQEAAAAAAAREAAAKRLRAAERAAEQAQRDATEAAALAARWAERAGWERERHKATARQRDAEDRQEALAGTRRSVTGEIERLVRARQAACDRRDEAAGYLRTWGLEASTDGHPPSESLDVLIEQHQLARQALAAAHPDSALLSAQQQARGALAEVRTKLDGHDAAAIALAHALLASPAGRSPEARAAATEEARQRHSEATERVGGLRNECQRAQETLAERCQQYADNRAPLNRTPADRREAERLAAELNEAASTANTERGRHEAERDGFRQEAKRLADEEAKYRTDAEELHETLGQYAEPAGRAVAALRAGPAAWEGKPGEAAAARRAATKRMQQAFREREEALKARTSALAALERLARSPRYAALFEGGRAPLLDRLVEDPDSVRAAEAPRLAQELARRAATIAADLAEIDQHRETITKLLTGRVREALRLLHDLENQSRLPSGLDEWTGRTYLAIRHADLPADPQQLTARVMTVVDRLTHGTAAGRTDGMALLFDALLTAIGPDGFRVGILKPHRRLRNVRVPIEEIRRFSGGQKLTAALVLFAALVRMREVARYHDLGRSEPGAPLLLDNPIGKASADTLIEVQRRVAARCGLQLIYTTGVSDLGALGQFTCVLRLDGKENLRTGAQHVVAAEKVTEVNGVRLVQRLGGAAT